MMSSEEKTSPSAGRLAILAIAILVLAGSGLKQKSKLAERGRKAAEAVQVQGAPIDSEAPPSKLQQKELPENANLEQMAKSAPAPKAKDGHVALTFDKLSEFDFPLTIEGTIGTLADGSKPSIPENIKKLDQQKVSLSGYVMPLNFQESKSNYFILIKNQLLCCYGQEPQVNEYCVVVMNKPVEVMVDRPVTVSGTLTVEETMDGDVLLSLYQLNGESLEPLDQ